MVSCVDDRKELSGAIYGQQPPGPARTHEDARRVAEGSDTALPNASAHATHGSVPALAAHTGIANFTVHRWLQLLSLQPHRHRRCKISTDSCVVDQVQDIVGL